MSLLPLCEKPLFFKSKDTVSKVSSKMHQENKYEAVIFDDEYIGLVFAKTLVKRRIDNPDKTEIGNFITKINPISSEHTLNDVVEMMLINDYVSVPIKKDNEILILTKIGILNSLKNSDTFHGKRMRDVMKFPYSVNKSDSIATAMSIIKETGVSRLPVLNENSEIEGLVDALDLLKADVSSAHKRVQKGFSYS